MTLEDFVQSTQADPHPPEELSGEMRSLWLAKKGRWHEAHEIAQDIDTATGSWIHALLHTIEGDLGNAGYWYARAGQPSIDVTEIDAEWERLARYLLTEGSEK